MTSEVIISIGQLVFSIVLAAVTVWYSIETSRMRRTADRQSKSMEASLTLTKASFDATLLPYLVLGINQADDNIWNEYAKKSKLGYINLPGYGRSGLPHRQDKQWVFNVVNVTDRIASHIFLIWFDQDDRKIFVSTFIVESVGPKEELIIPMSAGSVTGDKLERIIKEMYEGRGNYLLEKNRDYILSGVERRKESIIDSFIRANNSHLLAVFFDLAGKLYAIPRIIFEDESSGVYSFGKSDLIQPEFSFFAPTFESTRSI